MIVSNDENLSCFVIFTFAPIITHKSKTKSEAQWHNKWHLISAITWIHHFFSCFCLWESLCISHFECSTSNARRNEYWFNFDPSHPICIHRLRRSLHAQMHTLRSSANTKLTHVCEITALSHVQIDAFYFSRRRRPFINSFTLACSAVWCVCVCAVQRENNTCACILHTFGGMEKNSNSTMMCERQTNVTGRAAKYSNMRLIFVLLFWFMVATRV